MWGRKKSMRVREQHERRKGERERETHTEDWRESEETGGQADGCGLHPGRFLSARSVQ